MSSTKYWYFAVFSVVLATHAVSRADGTNLKPTDCVPVADIDDAGAIFPDATCQAVAINASGTVIGRCVSASLARSFRWTREKGSEDLSSLIGDLNFEAVGINDLGEIVGGANFGGALHAFLWSEASALRDLGTLAGGQSSTASAINNSSAVVGWADTGDVSGAVHAFLWTRDSGMQDLGTLAGGDSQAKAINGAGQVVGWSSGNPAFLTQAFFYDQANGIQALSQPAFDCTASGINDAAQIVGVIGKSPFLYDGDGLHRLPYSGTAIAINNTGKIVGQLQDELGRNGAYLIEDGRALRLDTLLPSDSPWKYLLAARAINDQGQIVGQGYVNWTPLARAYVLTPACIREVQLGRTGP